MEDVWSTHYYLLTDRTGPPTGFVPEVGPNASKTGSAPGEPGQLGPAERLRTRERQFSYQT